MRANLVAKGARHPLDAGRVGRVAAVDGAAADGEVRAGRDKDGAGRGGHGEDAGIDADHGGGVGVGLVGELGAAGVDVGQGLVGANLQGAVPGGKLGLEGAQTVEGLVDAGGGELTGVNGGADAVNGGGLDVVGVADHDIVDTGLQGEEGALDGAVGGADAVHLKAISHNDAIILKLLAQDVNDLGREGRGLVGAGELGHGNVGGHDHLDALGGGLLEGHELDSVELGAGLVNGGQAVVGVDGGVTVAGEVLDAGHDIVLAHALGAGGSKLGDLLGLVTGASDANDGVEGLRVDVADRGIVHVDAKVLEHLGGGSSDLNSGVERAGGAEGHGTGLLGRDRRGNAGDEAVLLVDSDEERLVVAGILGELLEITVEGTKLGGCTDVALEEDNGADAVILNQGLDVIVDFGVVEANGEELM